MAANTTEPKSQPSSDLGNYGRWLEAWIRHRPAIHQPSRRSLMDLDRELVSVVTQRVEIFETGQNDQLELPAGGTVEEMAIAAELTPMLDTLADLTAAEGREMTSGEIELLACRSWGDRPSLTQLRELGQDLVELTAAGMSPWEDLGFTPTAYLPSELRVIAQGADLTIDELYQL